MWSPDDPSNRMPMVWKDLEPYDDPAVRFNEDVFGHYRRLIALRKTLPELRLGLYRTILAEDDTGVLAFARDFNGRQAYVVINRGEKPRLAKLPVGPSANGTKLVSWLDPAETELVEPSADKADGRPALRPREGSRRWTAHDGTVELRLPPYGSAVLAAEN
jgi:cyclomaltodextrinase / maltogenic alpha-amylase / neopullulanase